MYAFEFVQGKELPPKISKEFKTLGKTLGLLFIFLTLVSVYYRE
jgi:hypothetical protein